MSETNNLADLKNQGKGKKMLLMLAVVFLLPFTIAATLHLLEIRPSGKSFGYLIAPPISLNIPAFTKILQDETMPPEHWSKIWNIVMIDDASCAESCQLNVDKIDRVHRTLPKEVDRIQTLLILTGHIDLDKVNALQDKFPKLIILSGNGAEQQSFMNHFSNAAPIDSVYLVDPINNLMMNYPNNLQPKELRGDLVRLLKNSWGG